MPGIRKSHNVALRRMFWERLREGYVRQDVRTEVLQRHRSLRTCRPQTVVRSRCRVPADEVGRQYVVVQIPGVLSAERVRTLTVVPLALILVLVRKFDLFPRDAPNNELLWWPREKKGLCRGVDDIDVLDDVCGSEKWAHFTKGGESYAVQLEEFHLRQLALGV